MNENRNLPALTSEEKLKMENTLLKAKLTAEHGMKDLEVNMNFEMENKWLKYLYDFENKYKESKKISVYDFLGKPEFKYVKTLTENEITSELDRLLNIMEDNNIILDVLCDYEEEVIYKFITEELFLEETDDMRIEGMNRCFIYEEFHPNHEYDLKYQTDLLINSIFEKEWNSEFDNYNLSEKVFFRGKTYIIKDFVKFIFIFQDTFFPVKIKMKEIEKVDFDLDKCEAEVTGFISYESKSENFFGEFKVRFNYELEFWNVRSMKFPKFG